MSKIDLKAIVEQHCEDARRYSLSIDPLVLLEEVRMSDFQILDEESYKNQIANGNQFTCDGSDIGLYVWNPLGKTLYGEKCLEKWAAGSQLDMANKIDSGAHDYVKYRSIADILAKKNAVLREIQRKIQELSQIRRNLSYNVTNSEGLAKAYQKVSLEIVEKCEKVVQDVLLSL